jgi:ADP-ribose pyrophosphatase
MGDIVREIAAEEGAPATREGLQTVRKNLDDLYGRFYLPERVAEEIERLGNSCVVTGIRTSQDYELLRSRFDFFLLFVDAPRDTRRERVLARGETHDPQAAEEFERQDASEREMFDLDWLEARCDATIPCGMPMVEFLAGFDDVEERVRQACEAAGMRVGIDPLTEFEGKEFQRRKGDPTVLYEGQLFRLLKQTIEYSTRRGSGTFDTEIIERPPGVRVIVAREDAILLLREYRHEHGGWDVRLPGGKVFDSLHEYLEARKGQDAVLRGAFASARRELIEEAGVHATNPRLIYRSRAGATVNWDLLYFCVTEKVSLGTRDLDAGEVIHVEWTPRAEVRELCQRGEILEDRSAAVLQRYLTGGFA